jgi:hypothetical protein
MARVLIRVRNRPPRERYRTGLSREQMSLWFAGYPKAPGCDFRYGSSEILAASRCFPLFSQYQTFGASVRAYPFTLTMPACVLVSAIGRQRGPVWRSEGRGRLSHSRCRIVELAPKSLDCSRRILAAKHLSNFKRELPRDCYRVIARAHLVRSVSCLSKAFAATLMSAQK